jgi:hypothetical protein
MLTVLLALITNIMIASIPNIAPTIYDAATLGITWAFVAPALILTGKSLLSGIFDTMGKSLYERFTRAGERIILRLQHH